MDLSWSIKKAEHQRIDAFELWFWRRLLRVPWDCKEIQPVHPKENQSWIFTGSTDTKAEALMLWQPDAKIQLIEKDPDAGRDWGQEKGAAEDEMVRGITDSMDMNLSKLWEAVKGAWEPWVL